MKIKILQILILLLTFVSVNQWSIFPIGNLWLTWTLQISIIFFILLNKHILIPNRVNVYIKLYYIWITISIIRGLFTAENYIEYKQLITGTISLSSPLLIWLSFYPKILSQIYSYWVKYALFFFFIFFSWAVGWTQFYLSPLLLLFCYFSLLKREKAYIILILGLIYTLIEAEDSRAQFIKGFLSLFMGIIVYKANLLSNRLIKLGHIICYTSSLFLFIFILSDTFNFIQGNIDENDAINNNKERSYSEKDTRSLIYIDAISSSIDNNYIISGRTPARGNDINVSHILFQGGYDENVEFNKGERHRNEMLHINTFTWTGLIGLILYSLIYINSTYLAVYKSNNVYIRLLGCYVAFRWSFGWIEETNTFLISDFALWCMIGMCYSPLFRNMSNLEFKNWIRKLI